MKKNAFILLAAAVFSFALYGEAAADDFEVKSFPLCSFVQFEGGTFVIGEGCTSVTATRTVQPFKINSYETPYKLWFLVRLWAEMNGYVFQNPGQQGSLGLRGKNPSGVEGWQPVTNINWYDCIVWCNAFSEFSGKTPCYYVMDKNEKQILRDSGDTAWCDLAVCDFEADGYRLPTEAEWEFAARRTVNGYQSGAVASGQIPAPGKKDDSVTAEDVAWTPLNSKGTHLVGTAGTPFVPDAPPQPGSGRANASGLFDMSGNVLEWCWDWFAEYKEKKGRAAGPELGSERVMRGGSYNEYTLFLNAGDRYSYDPNEYFNYFGFRIASSR